LKKTDIEKVSRAIIDRLKEEKSLVEIPEPRRTFKGKLEESAILLLSDLHLGRENHFIDIETGRDYLTYNREIAIKEANRLLDGVQRINELLSRSYKIDKLYIFVLGDLIEGQELFSEQQLLIEEGIGRQMLFAIRLLSDLIKELLKEFKEIKIVNVPGNHGRLIKKSYSFEVYYNNIDFLIGKMLQAIFEKEKRIEIQTPESWFFRTKVYDWQYFLHHGATIRSWMGIPYYGIVRQSRQRKAEMDIDIECIGHFHMQLEIPISSESLTLVNGCWIEKDSYAWNKYGRLTKPEQIYFGVSPKRPRTWQFALNLRPKEKQKEPRIKIESLSSPKEKENEIKK